MEFRKGVLHVNIMMTVDGKLCNNDGLIGQPWLPISLRWIYGQFILSVKSIKPLFMFYNLPPTFSSVNAKAIVPQC